MYAVMRLLIYFDAFICVVKFVIFAARIGASKKPFSLWGYVL